VGAQWLSKCHRRSGKTKVSQGKSVLVKVGQYMSEEVTVGMMRAQYRLGKIS